MAVQTKQPFETPLPDNPKLNLSYSGEFMIVLNIEPVCLRVSPRNTCSVTCNISFALFVVMDLLGKNGRMGLYARSFCSPRFCLFETSSSIMSRNVSSSSALTWFWGRGTQASTLFSSSCALKPHQEASGRICMVASNNMEQKKINAASFYTMCLPPIKICL